MLQSTSSQHSHQSNQQHNINNNLDEIAERQLVRLGSELQESLTAFFNRILSKNKFLFNIRRLQGLIVHNSWSNGFGTEYENLRDVITNITRKYHNSSGIWGLHGANIRFAHIHWLHMCTSYSNGDCKCRITEYLRNNGYTIHWDKRYSQEGLARRLAQSTIYLYYIPKNHLTIIIRRDDDTLILLLIITTANNIFHFVKEVLIKSFLNQSFNLFNLLMVIYSNSLY